MSTLKNKPKSWKEQSLPDVGDWRVKGGLAQMLKGGVIMDVVTPDEAKVAEDAGAVAVMALERVPSDIRRDGGVARASDPEMITGIIEAVSIPVMAKARIGHFAEAQVLEALGVDYCDESEVLTPADNEYHINKWENKTKVSFKQDQKVTTHYLFLKNESFFTRVSPHVQYFLNEIRKHFKISIYTAGTNDYAHKVIDKISDEKIFELILSREKCLKPNYQKNIDYYDKNSDFNIHHCQSYINYENDINNIYRNIFDYELSHDENQIEIILNNKEILLRKREKIDQLINLDIIPNF